MSLQTEKGVYFITDYMGERVKIGYGDVSARKRAFATTNSQDPILLAVATGKTREYERALHARFASSRCSGRAGKESFHFTPTLTRLIGEIQRDYKNVGAPLVPSRFMRYRSRDDRLQGRRRQ